MEDSKQDEAIHTTGDVAAAYGLLGEQITINNTASVQDAQRAGAADYDKGNARGYSAAGDWTPGTVERLAYNHGWTTGHARCTCEVQHPDWRVGTSYRMNKLPEKF